MTKSVRDVLNTIYVIVIAIAFLGFWGMYGLIDRDVLGSIFDGLNN